MRHRWFYSVASLVASAGMAAAQAPAPAYSTAPTPASTSVPLLVNGSPAPAEMLKKPKPTKSADIKPVVATGDATPAARAASAAPALAPAGGAPLVPVPAGSCGTGDGPHELTGAFGGSEVPYRHVWGRAEYLLWYLKNEPLRTVLGTIPDADAALGELPPNDITSTFGGPTIKYGALSGVRLELGASLDDQGCWGVSGEFFQLEHASRGFSQSSGPLGSPTIGPVFFDPNINRQVIVLFSDPTINAGTISALTQARLWGAEVDARRRLPTIFSDRLDFLVGYRHIGFDESLDVNGTTTFISPAPSPFHTISFADHFGVHNNFDGAIVGLESEYDVSNFFLIARGKFGMGNVHESTSVVGATSFASTDPTMPSQAFGGGILAQPTNSGKLSRDRFSFLGEITLNAGVRMFNDHVKAYVGYNFLGLSKVVRAGDLVDDVDSRIVPSLQGPTRILAVSAPTPKLDDGRFWAEGLNFGLSFEY